MIYYQLVPILHGTGGILYIIIIIRRHRLQRDIIITFFFSAPKIAHYKMNNDRAVVSPSRKVSENHYYNRERVGRWIIILFDGVKKGSQITAQKRKDGDVSAGRGRTRLWWRRRRCFSREASVLDVLSSLTRRIPVARKMYYELSKWHIWASSSNKLLGRPETLYFTGVTARLVINQIHCFLLRIVRMHVLVACVRT